MAVGALAILVRLPFALFAYGTSDVMTWELLGRLLLSGENFYATQLHNWPALWIYFCAAAVLIHDATGLPFFALIKLPPIVADAIIAVLVFRFGLQTRIMPGRPDPVQDEAIPSGADDVNQDGRSIWKGTSPSGRQDPVRDEAIPSGGDDLVKGGRSGPGGTSEPLQDGRSIWEETFTAERPDPVRDEAIPSGGDDVVQDGRGLHWRAAALLGVAYALNPVSILISGYHGQFDALMLAPTVLAVYLLTLRKAPLTVSALALGLGIWFKPIPLLLLPVLLPRLATWRDRAVFTLLALAPATLGTLPYFVRWPEDVATNFLGYSSWFGQWGFAVAWMVVEYLHSGTVPWWLPDPDYVSAPLHALYLAGRWVLVAALAATWWLVFRRPMGLLRGITATFAVFYFATSGFGVQYLLWILPFATVRRDRWLIPFSVCATLLLVVAYAIGLAYAPLDVVPDNAPSGREFIVKLATLPAWIVSGAWAYALLRRSGAGGIAARRREGSAGTESSLPREAGLRWPRP